MKMTSFVPLKYCALWPLINNIYKKVKKNVRKLFFAISVSGTEFCLHK